jgi:hypothetical protein
MEQTVKPTSQQRNNSKPRPLLFRTDDYLVGPGTYDPVYSEIGKTFHTVAGHHQLKNSPQFADSKRPPLLQTLNQVVSAVLSNSKPKTPELHAVKKKERV